MRALSFTHTAFWTLASGTDLRRACVEHFCGTRRRGVDDAEAWKNTMTTQPGERCSSWGDKGDRCCSVGEGDRPQDLRGILTIYAVEAADKPD